MNIILFTPAELNNPLKFTDERAKHIINILHKTVNQTFEAGIINGKAGTALITSMDNKQISFSFTPESDGKPLYPLTMIIGFPRPIQLKRLFRDVASLGACCIYLTGTELGEKSYMQSSLIESGSAYKMLLDGSVQAKSTHIPKLVLNKTLKECLLNLQSTQNENKSTYIKAALDNVNPTCTLSALIKTTSNSQHFYAAIGSERGWSENERILLESYGFTRCSMGTRVLRTETAAITAASIILNQGLNVI